MIQPLRNDTIGPIKRYLQPHGPALLGSDGHVYGIGRYKSGSDRRLFGYRFFPPTQMLYAICYEGSTRSILGSQSRDSLRAMVHALQLHPWLNTGEDWIRWCAAQIELKRKPKQLRGY